MALNFPDNPTLNQVYTDTTSGFSYQWDGVVWQSYSPSASKNISIVDDIEGSFNGSTQTFSLAVSGTSFVPANDQQLRVVLGGIVQEPGTDYTVSGSNITFTTAPTGGLDCSIVSLGPAVPLSVVGDGTVTPAKLSTGGPYWNTGGDVTITGTGTTSLLVNGNARVTGILTVGTSSITLDGQNNEIKVGTGATISSTGITVGFITATGATNLGGNLNVTGATNLNSTLNVSGISTLGTVSIASGIVSATSGVVTYYGDGSNLNLTGNTTAGVSSTSSVNTVGVVTAGIIDGFIPADQKVVSANLTINNNQENISFAEDLVIGTGVTFTVSAGSTVRMDAFNVINSTSVTSTNVVVTGDLDIPSGTADQRPSAPTAGSIRYNSYYNWLEIYTGTEWGIVANVLPNADNRGVFGAGSPAQTTMDYINISTTGNATIFGTLLFSRRELAACSSNTRGVFGGGYGFPSPFSSLSPYADYITISTTGNAIEFGSLSVARRALSACSSITRGIFGGGATPIANNTIDYITIATTGNATDFGDLTVARQQLASCSSSTRGVFGGGPGPSNVIDFITIATTGNATDFGDLTAGRNWLASCSSSTRGVFGGGLNPALTNTIDYITIASTGNATDFGDLTVARQQLASCSSSTRGVFGGGYVAPAQQNVIDYITIASAGNATDFGDLVYARQQLAACSNAHGGLS